MKRVAMVVLIVPMVLALGRSLAQDKGQTVPKEGLNITGNIANEDPKVKVDLPPEGSKGLEIPAKTYVVLLQPGKRYRIDLVSKDKELDPFLVLQDQGGKQLAYDDDGGGFPNAAIIFDSLQGGTYKVVAAAFRKTGAFSLTVKEEGEAKVHEVGAGLKLKGQLTPQVRFQNHNVTLLQGKTYTIGMVTSNPGTLDPLLRLYNAGGKELAYDDDGGGPPNARIIFTAPANGVFRILARSHSLVAGTGDYTLEVFEGVKKEEKKTK